MNFKKDKGSVLGKVILFFVGCGLLFVVPPLGAIILVYWFVSLFFSGRGEVKTVSISG